MNTAANDNRKHDAFLKYGLICEMYFGKMMQMKEISSELNCNIVTVSKAISLYLEKPVYPIVLCSAINDNKGYIRAMWEHENTKQICAALNSYSRKVNSIAMGMGLKPRNETKVKRPPYSTRNTQIVINEQTGIFYMNVSEAGQAHSIFRSTLRDHFDGKLFHKKAYLLKKV